jgi:hypothetical protein
MGEVGAMAIFRQLTPRHDAKPLPFNNEAIVAQERSLISIWFTGRGWLFVDSLASAISTRYRPVRRSRRTWERT